MTRRAERALWLSGGIVLGWLVSAIVRALVWQAMQPLEVWVEMPRPPACEAPRLPVT